MGNQTERSHLKTILDEQVESPTSPSHPSGDPGLAATGEAGFTLIELIIVVVLLAILAAIAAPTWFNFLRQQRINAVRDQVYTILQEARDDAKEDKLSRTVFFDTSTDPPTVRRYVDDNFSTPLTEELNGDGNVQANMVALSFPENWQVIQFDYQGLPVGVSTTVTSAADFANFVEFGSASAPSFTVTAQLPEGNDDAFNRCIRVQTLLGGLVSLEQGECN